MVTIITVHYYSPIIIINMETGSKASICNIIKYVSSHDLQIMHIQYAMVDAGTHVEKKKKKYCMYMWLSVGLAN